MRAGIDIGNSRSKLGLYHADGSVDVEVLDSSSQALLDVIKRYKIKEVIASSVKADVVDDKSMMQMLSTFIWLNHHTPVPIGIDYQTKETLGHDRIALAVGAHFLNQDNEAPVLVVDAGTCITMDVVTADGRFIGGNISPGIHMRLEAMHNFTASLPLVELSNWKTEIGGSTNEAILLGAALGAVCEIEGYYDRLRSDFPGLNLFLTGGDAMLISEKLERKIFLHPLLLHVGLREILKFNAD